MPSFGSKGEITVNLRTVAKNLKTEDLAYILDSWINTNGSSAFKTGKELGQMFRETHRTLQGLLVNMCLGILAGISEQEYTDPRNQRAIQTAKEITRQVTEGELPLQPFI